MVKSLYTLRLSSGYNDLLNSENLKVDIGKLWPSAKYERNPERNMECRSLTRNLCGRGRGRGRGRRR